MNIATHRAPIAAGICALILALLAGCAPSSSSSGGGGGGDSNPGGEGTASTPMTLTVGALAHGGEVANGGFSYYVTNHGAAINVQVTNLSADVDLEIFENANFSSSPVGCSNNTGTTSESCTDASGSVSTFYILVEDVGGAATYDIVVNDAS